MKKIIALSLFLFFVTNSQAQKKLTPVTQSELTGIGLPKDSKLDNRMLSVAAAATLLEMESDKVNTKVQNTEVLVLPPVSINKFNKDSLVRRLIARNWKTIATEDNKFVWLQKENRFVIAYFSTNTKQTDLYFADAASTPNFATQANNASGNSAATLPVVQPESQSIVQPATQPQQNSNTNTNPSILGMWTMSSSDQSSWRMNNGVMNYIKRQYTLHEDGTYTFITKTFDPLMANLLLGKESGTFQISGNNLTINPKKSVLEAWSKKDGTDNWGTFLSTQNIALEKVTYQFTRHYMSGIKEWQLVLQAPAPTKREGPFSGNSSFSNAYYYTTISTSHPVIELPADQLAGQETKKQSTNTPAVKSAFTFTTSNFDDGWTSTVQEDWVHVVKGEVTVLIHYPTSKIDVSSMDYKTISGNAWNTLVAPRYNSLNNFVLLSGTSDYEKPHFISADVTDNKTSKKLYVALFKKGNSGWIEFITTDKNSFVQAFGIDINKVDYYNTETAAWDPLKKMANYNKFAVAVTDLNGTWTSNFSGMTQYVNIYTGANAGATSHSSTESFQFKGTAYHWELAAASGVVGNLKFSGAKSDGSLSLPNNWQIHFSDLEGKPKLYNAYFSCIKGARILWLQDTGYGDYTSYGKKE